MKISKRQLKRIIKEEKTKVLREYNGNPAAAGMRAARHEGRVDYGHMAKQVNANAQALEQLLMDAENAMIAHDHRSLAEDLERLVDDTYRLAVTFKSLSEQQ